MSKAQAWTTDDADALPDRVLAELEATEVERGRPLIAVDADEVLVHFAEHFRDWCVGRGLRFELVEYRLDNALRHADGTALTREEITPLIWEFIETQTRWQRPIDGAAAALHRLSEAAQIVVLTNAPAKVREDRVANLADLAMPWPVVMNEGGKGRALKWLVERADAPVAFIDDSVAQHASAAKHAPEVLRFHMVLPELLKPVIGEAEGAHARLHGWGEATSAIAKALANDG
ncbi:MAG: HAD family hydrolase [Pseudomonadota bacterium]